MKHLLLAPCLLLAVPVAAQNLAIEHRRSAAWWRASTRASTPASPRRRKSRERACTSGAGGAGRNWYYVEMKSDSPCHAGVLPRPKRELVGRNLEYYLEASDRGFAAARTEEYRAHVVEKASDCDAKPLLPALLNKAAVAVFPALPAGFAGAARPRHDRRDRRRRRGARGRRRGGGDERRRDVPRRRPRPPARRRPSRPRPRRPPPRRSRGSRRCSRC